MEMVDLTTKKWYCGSKLGNLSLSLHKYDIYIYICIYVYVYIYIDIYILCNQKEFLVCLKMVYTPIYVSFSR